MKKLTVIIALALTSFASFGQGFFTFSSIARSVWDAYSSTPKLAADINVGFLIGNGTALVSGIAASIPTNVSSAAISWTPTQAWNAITADPNYSIAINNGTSAKVVQAIAANGSWSYNASGSFGVTGTSSGVPIDVIVFGWSSAYATPALAAAAGSPVGWSAPFVYTPVNNIGTPASMAASGFLPFGVTTPVPEPATIALAGLGGLALIALRRRTSK